MYSNIYEKISDNPKYLQLKRRRRRFAWSLTLLVLAVYLGYLALVAFARPLLAEPLPGLTAMTWGIPLGVAVIVFTIAVTGLYVYRANAEFDALRDEIIRDLRK
ncbi:MAG TPA: DUF485 domain-containing protein [Azonexus sp.]